MLIVVLLVFIYKQIFVPLLQNMQNMWQILETRSVMPPLPEIFRVRQTFAGPHLADVAAAVHAQLTGLNLGQKIRQGQSVAITAGSRGIANIAAILRAAVEHLQASAHGRFSSPPWAATAAEPPRGNAN